MASESGTLPHFSIGMAFERNRHLYNLRAFDSPKVQQWGTMRRRNEVVPSAGRICALFEDGQQKDDEGLQFMLKRTTSCSRYPVRTAMLPEMHAGRVSYFLVPWGRRVRWA